MILKRMRLALIVASLLACGLAYTPPEQTLPAKGTVEHYECFLQPEDFARAKEMPVNIPTDAELDAIQNSKIFEGDIDGVSDETPRTRGRRSEPMSSEFEIIPVVQHSSINLATFRNGLWPAARVPYVMEPGMTTQQRAAIAQAVEEYNRKTCVRMVPREERDRDFVFLRRTGANGCSSFIGRIGGNQTVSLANGCYSRGIVVHEIMHAIGFFHEHSRPDRDRFVRVAFENIRPESRHNFALQSSRVIDTQGQPYDYGSLMHYHRTAFSANGQDTIVPTDRNARIGNRSGLSETDAAKINLLYKC